MPEDKKRKQWQVPPYMPSGSNKKDVHAWFIQQVDDGREFLEASPGNTQLEESIRLLSGKPSKELQDKIDEGYSSLNVNHAKRNLREMVNALSEIRYNPGYKSNDKNLTKTAELMNNVGLSWYLESFVDLKIKKAIQWAAICPKGWLEICYRRIPGDHGRAEIDTIPHSWFDVVMTGVPESGDHQEAYTVTIIKDLPVFLAHATWPDHTSVLKPDRETPKGWLARTKAKVEKVMGHVFDQEPEKSTAKNPTCRLYYQFVLDLAINRTKTTLKMGYEKKTVKDPVTGAESTQYAETPWSYDVPGLGEPILRGYKWNETQRVQEPVYAPATHDDARIFPGRRLLVGNDTDLIYDGPMFDWHGKVPLVPFCADSWPFGEFSMLHDMVSPHETINEIDRVSHQTMRNRFNPTLLYNLRAVDKTKAGSIRSDIQGDRIGYNGGEVSTADKAVSPLFTAAFNTIEGWVPEFRKYLIEQEDYMSGKPQFSALSKLKGSQNEEQSEKILSEAGPIVKGISRDMERSMRDFSDMFKYYVFQYKTTPELMWMVGEDGITPQNFDFDPGNLIPSHLPSENKEQKSVYSKMQRARWLAEHVKFLLLPGTLHEIVQTQQKLLYINLWQKGFPIDPVTLGEILRLGNVGQLEGSTMIERYFNWKKKEMEMMIAIKQEAAALMGEDGEMGDNANKLGPKGGQKGKGGRAPTAGAPPKVQQKGDGRVVSRESA